MAMVKIGKTIACLFFFVATASLAFGAEHPKVTVVASPNPLPESESLQLRIEIASIGTAQVYRPEFDAPDFTPVGSGLSGGTTSVMINGEIQMEKHVVYTFVLFPKRPGFLKISNISVRVGSENVRTEDMNIKVLEESPGKSQGSRAPISNSSQDEEDDSSNPAAPGNFQGNSASKSSPSAASGHAATSSHPLTFNSDFTVHAEVSKTSVYVGEPIVVEYFVFDRGGVRQMDVKKWPTFTGFWNEDLELVQHYQFENIYIKNERMRRAFLGRYAIYPIKPGKISLDKLVVNARYVSRNFFNSDDDMDPMNIFMGGFGPMRTGTHASQDITIESLPLPEAGRPENFGGAVGQFTLKLDADKTSVPANTPINITLTLEGKGNFQAVSSFKLPIPQDFELYETAASARGANPVGMRRALDSKKTFQYVVIPRKSGNFQIPSIAWSFFDPEKKSYQSVSTNSLALTVSENNNPSQSANNNYLSTPEQQQGNKLQDDLRYIKESVGNSVPWGKIIGLFLVLAAAVNALLIFRIVRSKGSAWVSPLLKKDPFEFAHSNLARIRKTNSKEALSELEETLYEAIQSILGSNPRGMTRGELEESWKAAGLPFDIFQKTSTFLDTLDQLRFSSSSKQDVLAARSKLFSDAEEILKSASKIKRK